ncbi:MAG: non-ribosomal peptide synthetase, partial [Cyclobacteriaceae bacterium]
VLEAFSHKNLPFESLVQELKPERYLSTNPLFQAMFLYHNVPSTPNFGPDLNLQYKPFDFGVSKFDLTLYISEEGDQLSATIEYASDLFDQATIERMQGHLRTLMEGIANNPQQCIDALPMLTESERQQILVEWNETADPPSEAGCIHQLIEGQALTNPDHPAVICRGESLTYETLNLRANEVATRLIGAGAGRGSRIGLCTDRSHELIIGMLGILKAGAAYVPLDPEYPAKRVHYMIQDAAMSLILTQAHLVDLFVETKVKILNLDASVKLPPEINTKSFPEISGSDTSYVIYTSGSTGQPKGVPVSHRNLLHSTTARFSYYPSQPGVFLLLSSFGFDSSVAGIFWSLCYGGTLVLAERRIEQDIDALATLIMEQSITHTLLLPSLYELLLRHAPPAKLTSLNTVIVAGEACTAAVCQRHFEILPSIGLYNEYGPTEATVWSTVHQIQLEDTTGLVPIGRPIGKTQHYILDTNLQPVPVGIAGELYIGGAGVTQGYLNLPELTAMQFVPDPFSDNPSALLYKTGDLARYRSDGVIVFLGRSDQQVKIRGHRIEPEEIQEVLMHYQGVREAVLAVRQKAGKNSPEMVVSEDIDHLTETMQSLPAEVAEHLLRSVELSTLLPISSQSKNA